MKELEDIIFYKIPVSFVKDTSAEAEELIIKMSKARGLLHFDLPFFGFLLTQLEIFPVANQAKVKSFAMDTRKLYVNTPYFEMMRPSEMRAVLLHAIIHLVLKHGERSKGMNKQIWGISADINAHLLVKSTLYEQRLLVNNTKYALEDHNTKYELEDLSNISEIMHDSTVEDINKKLYSFANSYLKKEDLNISPANKEFSEDIIMEILNYVGMKKPCNYIDNYEEMMNGMTKSLKQAENDRFMGMVKYAYDQAKRQGKLPSNLQYYIEGLLYPKIPWYTYLEQYIQQSIISDYRWVPPNRRFIHNDIVLPSTKKENIDVIIALDTSGSVSNEELKSFLSESMAIFNSFGNINMTVIQCDAEIQHVVHIEAGENIDGEELPWEDNTIYGRGGTSFIPVFNYIIEKEINASVLLYFTDGYGSFPLYEPEYDTIWIMTTEVIPPFGSVIEYNIEP